jgi:HlyD family secretion protein
MPNIAYISPTDVDVLSLETNLVPKEVALTSKSQDWFYGTEELLDALPKIWTRSLLYLLIGCTAVILPWSMLAQVDETGSAIGRLEPKGASQKLDSSVTGSVISVNVKEGMNVKAGQVLLELESHVLRSELEQTQTKLETLVNQQAQLELLKNQLLMAINLQQQQNQSQELEKIAQLHQVKQNLDVKQSAYNLQKWENLTQLEQAKESLSSAQITYNLSETRWRRDLIEISRYHSLLTTGVIPQIKFVEVERTNEDSQKIREEAKANLQQAKLRLQEEISRYQATMNQAQSDIKIAKFRLQEEESSYHSVIQAARLTLLKTQEEFKDLQTKISSSHSDIAQTTSQIAALKYQLQQRIVRSPINGTIFDLPIKNPGSVVQTGQMVALIAPEKATLIVKAYIPSQQSGFIKLGMPVKVKFDAYPFQEYGVIKGHVTWISPDSKIQDNGQQRLETYELNIGLEHPYIISGNKQIYLKTGQKATAEVIVRQRRIIDFILDPFKKLHSSGLNL